MFCICAQHVIDDKQGWRGTTDFRPAPLQQKESRVAKSGQVQKKPVWFLSWLTKSEVVQCLQYNVRSRVEPFMIETLLKSFSFYVG